MSTVNDTWSCRVVEYNAFLRSLNIFSDGQIERCSLIASILHESAKTQSADIYVFNEVFDKECYDIISKHMKLNGVGYRTPILGSRNLDPSTRLDALLSSHRLIWCSGGVVIFSRHPILASNAIVFDEKEAIRSDSLALKGFIYVKILKDIGNSQSKVIHVVGTHLQSGSNTKDAAFRVLQANKIRCFVESLNIPPEEAVLIIGDLNTDGQFLQASEWVNLSQALKASAVANHTEISVDPSTNTLVGRDGFSDIAPCRLDHCLYSTTHLKPIPLLSFTEVIRLKVPAGKTLTFGSQYAFRKESQQIQSTDLSDHFPVVGHFAFPK